MKMKSFKITYIGENVPTKKDINKALIKGDIDDQGLVKIELIKERKKSK